MRCFGPGAPPPAWSGGHLLALGARMTWSTDALCRETAQGAAPCRTEGILVADREAAAVFAVTEHRAAAAAAEFRAAVAARLWGPLPARHRRPSPSDHPARHAQFYRLTARNRIWLARRSLPALLIRASLATWAALTVWRV